MGGGNLGGVIGLGAGGRGMGKGGGSGGGSGKGDRIFTNSNIRNPIQQWGAHPFDGWFPLMPMVLM